MTGPGCASIMTAASTLPIGPSQRTALLSNFHANASIRFKGALSVPALRRALAFVMKRHEGLRMRIVRDDEHVRQYLVESIDRYDMPVLAVGSLAAAEERIRRACWSSPIDLAKDGPLHAELLKVGEDEHVLLLVIHYVVVDPFALGLFTKDLLHSYACYARGEEPLLPPAMRYSEHLLHEVQCGEGLTDPQLRYWRSVLSGSRAAIPRQEDHSTPSVVRQRIITRSITAVETRRLEQFAAAANVSMAAAVYAIIFLAVSSQYSASDIRATVYYSGRDSQALRTLGSRTARAFPVRMAMNGTKSLAEFTRKMQTVFVQAAMASRPPYTYLRLVEQVLAAPLPAPGAAARPDSAQSGIHLYITDQMNTQRELEVATPHLSAERILLHPRVHESRELDWQQVNAAPPTLVISLRRDLAAEPGRPLTFVGLFYRHVMEESDVSRLLETTCDIARKARWENLDTPVIELISGLSNGCRRDA
jgi:hypothetical protein